jgi:hypothetical protein
MEAVGNGVIYRLGGIDIEIGLHMYDTVRYIYHRNVDA